MTKDQAVEALDALPEHGDTAADHGTADGILLKYLEQNGGEEVADAWRTASKRVGFWYA